MTNRSDEAGSEALERQLASLVAAFELEDSPKAKAELALLVAQARRELADEQEVRRRLSQPWWKSRTFEVISGVLLASVLVAFFMVDNFLPLLQKDNERLNLDAQIALKKAQIVEFQNEQVEQENSRISRELEDTRTQLAAANAAMNRQLEDAEGEARRALAEREQEISELRSRGVEAEAQLTSANDELRRLGDRLALIDEARQKGDTIAQQLAVADVVLVSCGDKKIQVIKELRSFTGLGLADTKDLVDSAPVTVGSRLTVAQAEGLAGKLRRAGCGGFGSYATDSP